MLSQPSHALIVGGGIAGPALALFLHKAGIRAEVYEAYPEDTAATSGALGLAPNGMHVLRELGLADQVRAAGTSITHFDFRTHRGRRLGTMAYGSSSSAEAAVSLSRQTLQDILRQAMQAEGIPIHYRKRLQRIEQDEHGVTAYFEDGTQARGDLLIGADGIWSKVRELILPDAPKPGFTGLVGYGGFAPRRLLSRDDASNPQAITLCFGHGPFLGYALGNNDSEGHGAYWWSAWPSEQPLDAEQLRTMNDPAMRRQLGEAGGGWFGPVPALLQETRQVIAINIFDVASLPRWWQGRVALIGDAAHAVSPHSGQGASMALEDTISLASLLCQQPSSPMQAFAQFERLRRERVERIIAFGRRSGDSKRRGRFAAWLQLQLMPLFLHFGRHSMDWIHDYRPSWNVTSPDRPT